MTEMAFLLSRRQPHSRMPHLQSPASAGSAAAAHLPLATLAHMALIIPYTSHSHGLSSSFPDGGREVGQARGRIGWCRGAPPRSASPSLPFCSPMWDRVWRHHHRESIVGTPEAEGAQPPNTAGGNTTRGETANSTRGNPTRTRQHSQFQFQQ